MAKVRASVTNQQGVHEISLQTNALAHSIPIPLKGEGYGSSARGGAPVLLKSCEVIEQE